MTALASHMAAMAWPGRPRASSQLEPATAIRAVTVDSATTRSTGAAPRARSGPTPLTLSKGGPASSSRTVAASPNARA